MNHLPKFKDLNAPGGYFEGLPDQIMAKVSPRKSNSWTRYAAAAVFLFGLGISWQLGLFTPDSQAISMDEAANLYIESQIWSAEDVLSLYDDPNALLDQIIEEEMPTAEAWWVDEELNRF